ncbi:MAG: hypothetical protein H7240_07780 [Glaciimonas sp.]|nr:hypothetical protein [Glaciimonas sp.]
MTLLKYVITVDAGQAPNPFHGICSLALCTPNHAKAKLYVGDWIVCHTGKSGGRKLVFAMRITRVLDMAYFQNRFLSDGERPDAGIIKPASVFLNYFRFRRDQKLDSPRPTKNIA